MKALSKLKIGLIILAASLVLFLLAFFYYKSESGQIIKEKHEFLEAVTNIKLEQIVNWRDERIGDAEFFTTIGKIIKSTAELKANKNNKDAKQYFSSTLKRFKDNGYFDNVFITDVNGSLLFSLDSNFIIADHLQIEKLKYAVEKDSAIIGDFYFSETHKTLHFNVVSIIKDNYSIPIGVYVQIVDPYKSLYPIIQSWPVSSKSAETVLFKKVDDHVIYLNDLRHKKNSALSLKIHITESDIVAAKAVLGARGIIEGKDYRGKDVLAAVKTVPGTDWFMVSKVDKEEIYSELFYRAGVISLIALISILLISFSAFYIYKFQQSNAYKNLFLKEKELAETQEEYRTALYSIGDAVITTDSKGYIKYMNSVAEQLTGWKESEASGKILNNVFKIINEDTNNAVEDPVTKVLKIGSVVALTNHTMLIRKDGSKIPIADSGSPIRDAQNNIIGVVLVFRDQTDERAKEKSILESNDKFSKIFNSSSESISLTQMATGKVVEINEGFVEMFGYSRDEVIGFSTLDLGLWTNPFDRERIISILKTEGRIKNFEAVGKNKNGKLLSALISGEIIQIENAPFLLLTIRDITERITFEETLRASEEKYRLLIENQNDLVVKVSSDGLFTFVSTSYCKLFGKTEEELLGNSFVPLIHEDDRESTKQAMQVLYKEPFTCYIEQRAMTSKGWRWIAWSDKALLKSDGEIESVIGVGRDITEQKSFEESLMASEEKYRRMTLNSPMGMLFYELKGNNDLVLVGSNPASDKLLGIDHTKLLGRTIEQAFPPLANTEIPQRYREVASGGILWATEQIAYKDDKIEGVFEVKAYQTKPNNMVAVFADITQRKIFEESLKASEEKYRMLLDFASDAFFQGDINGNFLTVNNKAIELTGYSREELLKMNMKDLFPKEVLEKIPLRYDKLLAGDTIKTERVIVKKDGKSIYVEMTSKQMPDGTYQSFIRDITEIKKSEKELTASQERFSKAFTTSPDSININRISDGVYVSINKGFTKMTGYTEEEVIGKTLDEIQIWADIKYRNELVEKFKSTSVVDNFEAKFRMKEGIIKDGLMSAAIIELNDQPHIISITRDITERKQVEERLEQFFSVNPDLLCIADIEGNFIKVNKAWEDILGYSVSELEHRKFLEFVHPEDTDSTLEAMATLGKQEQVLNFINRYRCLDGSYRFLEWRSQPSGNLIYAAARDITERKKSEEILQETKIHYQKLIENAPDGIVQVTADGVFKYVSPSAKRIFGYPIHERVTESPNALTHPEDLPKVLRIVSDLINNPLLIPTIEYRFKDYNGNYIWIESTFTNLLNEPSVGAIVINFRDITERRKMEEAVEHSETKFYSLFENSPNAIFITDPETLIIIDCNANACSMNGYTHEELIGKSINILHPQNVSDQLTNSELHQDQIEILKQHKSVTIESVHKRKDGTVFPIESSISLISLSGKEVTMGIDRDITDRKKLLTEIMGSEEKFRSIWENSVDAMRLVDENGVIINVNVSYCSLFGLKKEDLIGNMFNVSYTITESKTMISGFKERFKNRTILKKFETEIQLTTGQLIWVELTNSFIEFEDKPAMLLSIIRDITDRKLLITELTDAKNKAEEMNKVKSYFFANMSHELRTPFVGILGFAEILKDTLKNSDEREYAEQILKSSKRLTDTLNKILNVTRLEFDKVDLKYKEIDISNLLKSVENFYQTSAKLNNTIITTKIKNESIFIRSDLKLMEDILNNLVSNAVKFTHDGNIILSAQKILSNDKYHISIKVEDNGIGIPKEKQSLVWQEFRQASEGFNRSFEGTGLGLTITKKYVEILGGEILLESEENRGTVFTILLPRDNHKISEVETAVKISNPRKTDIEKTSTRKHKILYVEDDMVALQFINIILKSTYDVETAFKAKAALELAEKENYDVLMLDINLGSGMDGVELMQKIRQIDYYKNIPIVAVTAYAAQSDKKEFLAKGFTHYISKPFSKKELFSLLQEVLSN